MVYRIIAETVVNTVSNLCLLFTCINMIEWFNNNLQFSYLEVYYIVYDFIYKMKYPDLKPVKSKWMFVSFY